MVLAARTYEDMALEEAGHQLELHQGVLREKPPMAYGHNYALRMLDRALILQLNPKQFHVSVNASRVRESMDTYFIPDLFVIPVEMMQRYRHRPRTLEVYTDPLPLVVEIWSPSPGDYDIDTKIPTYQSRGDSEIWRLHPYERTLTAWRRQPDGSYANSVHHGGAVEPVALAGVVIDLDELFDSDAPQ